MDLHRVGEDRGDERSPLHRRRERFFLASGALLSGRIDGRGRRLEANAGLDRLLDGRGIESVDGLLPPGESETWRDALRQVERGETEVELRVSIEVAAGEFLPFRVRLEGADDGSIAFLAVPEGDLFESVGELYLALSAARKGLQRRGRIDPLTGLGDRGRADSWLKACVRRARRWGRPLACLMVDLDQFKRVNDTLGHLEGDRRLKAAATVLRSVSPPALAARFGGDEFLVLWPGVDREQAIESAEALRLALQEALGDGSASLGLACLREEDEPDFLLARADAALVRAKRLGRNRVETET